ncbi:hypothetical protein LSCM4_07467 [Leishmania orientalis]|uniref:Uncharacterized protein n=1 Tax=Leishmania orientalis TaxID=2249476 RepID=A0A836KUM6_9TRYP|nr:hypothetical protein LSCM4_07467 [Leishmania orientalis]
MLDNNDAQPPHRGMARISIGASCGVKPTKATDHFSDEDKGSLRMVDMLMRASDTIRAERGRADALEKENTALRAHLDGVRLAYQLTATQRARRDSQAVRGMAAPNKDDDDTLFAYVRDRLIGSGEHPSSGHEGARCADEGIPRTFPLQQQRPHSSDAAPKATVEEAARSRSRDSITASKQRCRKGWIAGITPPKSASPKTREHHASAAQEARAEQVYSSGTLRHCNLNAGKDNLNSCLTGAGSREVQTTAVLEEDDKGADASPGHWMACRLLRALAPRPTDCAVGDIVHTMVTALQHDVQTELNRPRDGADTTPSRIRDFALVRLRPCVYRLFVGSPTEVRAMERAARRRSSDTAQTASRFPSAALYRSHFLLYSPGKDSHAAAHVCPSQVTTSVIRLTIDAGTLRIVRGGGHIDFIDYLERRLRVKLFNTQARLS